MALTFESVREILSLTIHMKAMPSSTFLWCCLLCCTSCGSNFRPDFWVCGWNHVVWLFNRKLLSGTFQCYCLCIMLHKVVLPSYWVCGWHPAVWLFKRKLLSSTFQCYCLCIMLHKVVLTIESVDEILQCDYSKDSYWAVLSNVTVYVLCSTRWF